MNNQQNAASDLTEHFAWIKREKEAYKAFIEAEFAKLPNKPALNGREVRYAHLLHPYDDYSSRCGLYNSMGKLIFAFDTSDPQIAHLDPRFRVCHDDYDVLKNLKLL